MFRLMAAFLAVLALYAIIYWRLSWTITLLLFALFYLLQFLIPYRKTDERPWDSFRLSDNVKFEVTPDVNENICRFRAAQHAELQQRIERAKSGF